MYLGKSLVDIDRLRSFLTARFGLTLGLRKSCLLFQPCFHGIVSQIEAEHPGDETTAKGDWFLGQFFKNRCQFVQKHKIYRTNL
jgi:hypothetical protein